MVEFINVTKKYGKNILFQDISLHLEKGIYGLVGENGAGKTTLFKIIMNQESIFSGEIRIKGMRPSEESYKIGYLPQKFDFFHNLSLYKGMEYLCYLKGMKKNEIKSHIYFWLNQVHLLEEKDKKIDSLSGGMRQRMGIAQSFLANPEIVLLDEPTVGLDPKERLSFRNLVNEIGSEKTIFISTHIIEDIQATCENILVLHKGVFLYVGPTRVFIDSVKESVYVTRIMRSDLSKWNTILNIISIKLIGNELEIRYYMKSDETAPLSSISVACSLEDAYFIKTKMAYRKE